MNSPEPTQLGGAQATAAPLLQPGTCRPLGQEGLSNNATISSTSHPGASGYGLPCIKCRTYYPAALDACPVCKSTERVSPTLQASVAVPPTYQDPAPDPELLEQERERFLEEFRAQIGNNGLQINANSSFHCSKEENHEGSFEPAAVCQSCYDHLQERTDQFEAALLMDVKEATQIIYEAVWSDASDPSKTYQNAAQALLNEMRQRAGISPVLGPMQPLRH